MCRKMLVINVCIGLIFMGAAVKAAEPITPREDRSLLGVIVLNTTDLAKAVAYYSMLGFQEYGRRGEMPVRVVWFNFSSGRHVRRRDLLT